jgi:hypothetical protein
MPSITSLFVTRLYRAALAEQGKNDAALRRDEAAGDDAGGGARGLVKVR